MTSLLDIAPPEVASKNITIVRGERTNVITVVGLDALCIAKLIKRFPKFRLSAAGKDLTEDEMMDLGMEAGPAIIAMGMRSYDEETEKLVVDRLSLDEQTEAINAIMELTNPEVPKKGRPFRGARANRHGDGASGRAAVGTSP